VKIVFSLMVGLARLPDFRYVAAARIKVTDRSP
jgi:hypothetical protein